MLTDEVSGWSPETIPQNLILMKIDQPAREINKRELSERKDHEPVSDK